MSLPRTVVITAWFTTLTTLAHGQVYRCTKDGQTSFQEAPCDKNSVSKTLAVHESGSQNIFSAGLKSGMSIDEVRKLLPAAQPAVGSQLFNGATGKLRADHITMAGSSFDATFFFLSDKFYQVNLSGPFLVKNEENLRMFDKLSAELRAKYGSETAHKVTNNSTMLSADAEWSSSGSWAFVSVSPITADTSQITLGLRPGK